VALTLIGAISATRIYLGAHFPMDVLGGWMAGAALVAILVAVHVLRVDERQQARDAAAAAARGASGERRVAVPRRVSSGEG
jgi:membrane-associated phospholipid phosphatase